MIANTALICLALNVYHEARGEQVPGQYAVALVTMNRADQREERVCPEVFKRRQFSWANKGVVKTRQGWVIARAKLPHDDEAWARSLRVAAWTLAGRMPDLTQGSTHYHTHAVRPRWRLAMQATTRVGNHRFYRT